MLVRDRMSHNPITITNDTTVLDALDLMNKRKVRRLPILDGKGRLVGIVSDKDLLRATPSPATTLAVYEIPEALQKLTVEKVMTRKVVTVTEETTLEEAACILLDKRIGGLPVMRGETLVGIITETDMFKSLLTLMGGRREGVRVTVKVLNAKGTLAKVTGAVFGIGGDIVGIGITDETITMKVLDVSEKALSAALKPVVESVIDVRAVSGGGCA